MQIAFTSPAREETTAHAEQVRLAKQHDPAAWSAIYSENYVYVYRYVLAKLGRKEEAEDLTSQVFLEAMQGIGSYKDRGKPLLAWLYGIARNLVSNGVRKARRSERALREQAATQDGEYDGLNLDSLELLRAMQGLTEDQRETLVLRFFVGLSATETGRILGKTEQAVYALQVRAINSLRRAMREVPLPLEAEAA
jgi:RNA polymerase sigma-70 factor (ECF subfamily)